MISEHRYRCSHNYLRIRAHITATHSHYFALHCSALANTANTVPTLRTSMPYSRASDAPTRHHFNIGSKLIIFQNTIAFKLSPERSLRLTFSIQAVLSRQEVRKGCSVLPWVAPVAPLLQLHHAAMLSLLPSYGAAPSSLRITPTGVEHKFFPY